MLLLYLNMRTTRSTLSTFGSHFPAQRFTTNNLWPTLLLCVPSLGMIERVWTLRGRIPGVDRVFHLARVSDDRRRYDGLRKSSNEFIDQLDARTYQPDMMRPQM